MNLFVFLRNLRSNSNADVKSYEKTSRASEDLSLIEDRKSAISPEQVEEIEIIQPSPVLLTDAEVEGQVVIVGENASKASSNYMNSENPLTASKMNPIKNNLRSPRFVVTDQTSPIVSRPSLISPSSSTGRNSGSGRPSFNNFVASAGQDDIIEQQQHEKSKANHYAKLGQNFVQTGGGGGISSSILNSSRRVPAAHSGPPRKRHSSQITKTTPDGSSASQ